jgi:hypothetical protein
MQSITDNQRDTFYFARNNDYNIDIRFSKWTNGKSPVTKLIFDFLQNSSGKNIEMIKSIFCDAPTQETDKTVTKHLVLFIKEVQSINDDQHDETIRVPLSLNQKIRLVTVRYILNEPNVPKPNKINKKFYHDLINVIGSPGSGIPDTNNGGILIKR